MKENNKQIAVQKDKSISVKQILSSSWDNYVKSHKVESYQKKEVEKALKCHDLDNGCFVYRCECCNKNIFQSIGCNSRVCSCCGKRYTDQWSKNLSKAMFGVPHRHFVISVPDALWFFPSQLAYVESVYGLCYCCV